jgi:hypothetical protein
LNAPQQWLASARAIVARNGAGCVDKDTGALLDRPAEFPLPGDQAWCFRDHDSEKEPVRAQLIRCMDRDRDENLREWECFPEDGGPGFLLEQAWVRPTFVLLDLFTASTLVQFHDLFAKATNREKWLAYDVLTAVDVMWRVLERARTRRAAG